MKAVDYYEKNIIIVIACMLAAGAAFACAGSVFAETENTEQFINDESVNSVSERKSYVEFSPTKRITEDMDTVREAVKKEDDEELTRRIVEKFGYDPRLQKEKTNETILELNRIGLNFENEKLYTVLEKLSNDGYGDSGKDIIYVTGSFKLKENITKYCDLIIMACNAYNDPNYEISVHDRVVLLDFFDGAYSTLSRYGLKGKEDGEFIWSDEEIPDEVNVAKEIALKTLNAEYESISVK